MTPASSPPKDCFSIEEAAARLSTTAVALRARCRRAQRLERGQVVAPLGGGIVAFKFGANWRVRFPVPSTSGPVYGLADRA